MTGQPCNGTLSASFLPPVVDPGTVGTPGLPTTGAGGNASKNIALLLGVGLFTVLGISYVARKRAV